jgi:arylsulfatase A-like enzyme
MANKQPNIILIITDQQRYDTIRALGCPYMDTPVMDRLVREGVSFSNNHVSAPLCSPSRASLFTGYYPHTTGIYGNENLWRHSWVERLNQAGYYCVNVGKMHTYPFETPCGFDERYVVENKDRYFAHRFYFDEWDKALRARGLTKPARESYRARPDYADRLGAFEWELPEDAHSDFFVGDLVRWWLDTKPKPVSFQGAERPLFLQIGFPGPHPPYDPIPRYAAPYLERELPLPNVSEEELAHLPPPLQAQRQNCVEFDRDSIAYTLTPTREQLHRQRAYYLANVTMIDEKIGEILETLERHGYLDDAVVVLTSDHGDCLSDHGQSQKACMYDVITRVPLIVWAPGRFAGGRTVDALCQQMDVGSALLELAGVEVPETFEARSLLPALEGTSLRRARGKPWSGREVVYAELPRRGSDGGPSMMTMVRDREWKAVHFAGESYGQLFDLARDPDEVLNLWDDPAAAPHKRRLLDALLEWRIESQYRTRDLAQEWR